MVEQQHQNLWTAGGRLPPRPSSLLRPPASFGQGIESLPADCRICQKGGSSASPPRAIGVHRQSEPPLATLLAIRDSLPPHLQSKQLPGRTCGPGSQRCDRTPTPDHREVHVWLAIPPRALRLARWQKLAASGRQPQFGAVGSVV